MTIIIMEKILFNHSLNCIWLTFNGLSSLMVILDPSRSSFKNCTSITFIILVSVFLNAVEL